MSKRILFFSLVSVLFLTACEGRLPPGAPWLKEPKVGGGETVCLDEETVKAGLGQKLTNVPRPVDPRIEDKADNMYPTPLYDICSPPAENPCGPETSDYSLVATDVKLGQIVLSPDRLAAKQFSTPDSPLPSEYKDRIYRTFCGDWCYPASESEGYRGTFYCDFVFYLTSNNESGGPLLGNPDDSTMPPDDALFDVYFRIGAKIPEKIRCKEGETAQSQTAAEESKKPQFFINFLDTRWFFRDEGTVKLKDILKEKPAGEREFLGKLEIPEFGGIFEMYKNLFFKSGDEIIYGVEEGKLKQVTDPQERVAYKEFQKAAEVKPRGKTLQLGTFKPPISAGWVKSWLRESKPAIYLYPEEELKVNVKLSPAGRLTETDPPYDPKTGWEVLAFPNGILKPISNRQFPTSSFPYLYYEADLEKIFVKPEGFVVKGGDLVGFFEEVLPKVGLNQWETADFIQYWMKRLDVKKPYYFIHFLSKEQIEELEPLELSIEPDIEIRMRVYLKPLDKPIEVKEQRLPELPERQGFVLVEWGGMLDES